LFVSGGIRAGDHKTPMACLLVLHPRRHASNPNTRVIIFPLGESYKTITPYYRTILTQFVPSYVGQFYAGNQHTYNKNTHPSSPNTMLYLVSHDTLYKISNSAFLCIICAPLKIDTAKSVEKDKHHKKLHQFLRLWDGPLEQIPH